MTLSLTTVWRPPSPLATIPSLEVFVIATCSTSRLVPQDVTQGVPPKNVATMPWAPTRSIEVVVTEIGVSWALTPSLVASEIVVPFTINPRLLVPKLAVGPLSMVSAVAGKMTLPLAMLALPGRPELSLVMTIPPQSPCWGPDAQRPVRMDGQVWAKADWSFRLVKSLIRGSDVLLASSVPPLIVIGPPSDFTTSPG